MRRDQLDALYRQARYRVATPDGVVELRVGEPAPGLERLLARHGAARWGFLTAVNPGSRPLGDAENRARLERLERRLEGAGWIRYAGTGNDPQGRWPDEPSFLVLDAPLAALLALAAEFEQAALLAGRAGGVPELVFVAAPEGAGPA